MQTGPDVGPHVSYIECVRSLFVTPVPMLVMSIGYIASFSVLAFLSDDGAYALLAVIGVFSFSLRVVGFLRRDLCRPG